MLLFSINFDKCNFQRLELVSVMTLNFVITDLFQLYLQSLGRCKRLKNSFKRYKYMSSQHTHSVYVQKTCKVESREL